MQESTNRTAPPCPHTWLLLGHKAGDNTQLRALAHALGWPFEERHLRYRPWELLSNRLLGATLAGIDRAASDPLAPPWPDLVLTAGRRNEPVARWIRRQSGGRTRLVHVGRPWAPLQVFDLVVTTPQYELPQRNNVLVVDLPLHGLTRETLAAERVSCREKFRDLAPPYCSVLLGGDSGPFVFTPDKARRLAHWLNERLRARGGSVLAAGSPRTPAAAWRALVETLDVPAFTWGWGEAGDNPYRCLLAAADELVVTGESASMLAEAAVAGRPLFIFDLGDGPGGWRHAHAWRYKPLSHRLAMRFAPRRMRRDVRRIQDALIARGLAQRIGEASAAAPAGSLQGKGLREAARAVRELFREDMV
ncbi:MAG TPA: nucleoside-diphosphate sugar epimerase [Gammaproteobacteria bacterium]|nr:nucleoside-diphosphate sugar epimerase [Gammaproteobacteria bacterium]